MREIVLDTETTGLNPRGGDRVVEIGGVEMVNRVLTGNVFHAYINPERDMPREAFDVHGLSAEFLSDKPKFIAVADAFLDFIAGDTLVIHNATFDVGFLNAELERLGRPFITTDRVVDTIALARRKHPGSKAGLDALMARYGIDGSRRVKHGALLDAELLAEVYIELLGGRQTSLIGLSQDVEEAPRVVIAALPTHPRPVPLLARLTSADAEAHAAFVAGLGENAIWLKYAAERVE